MHHVIFEENNSYDVAILIKTSALNKVRMTEYYVQPLAAKHIPTNKVIAFSLEYNDVGKAPASLIKTYCNSLLKAVDSLSVKFLLVNDSAYFKYLTGVKKSEPYYGYTLPCKVKGFEHLEVVLGINYQAFFHDPNQKNKLELSLTALSTKHNGVPLILGKDIIHHAEYPSNYADIKKFLSKLHQHPMITCDIEAYSLQFWKAGIGTIEFSWSEHEGGAFQCDPEPNHPNYVIRAYLREFFETYKGKIIYHNANFDLKLLVYSLFMEDMLDYPNMNKGIQVMTKNIEDTKLIVYLATNSCAGNDLKLKSIAHEFAGNYAQSDINDITKIPLADLLRYNLIDGLATFWAFKKFYPQMVHDQQEEIYRTIFIPSVKVILQMELVGMPLNMANVLKAEKELVAIRQQATATLMAQGLVQDFIKWMRVQECNKMHDEWKQKTAPLEYFDYVEFNPNSNVQLQDLLYTFLGFTPVDFTDTKQPATGKDTLKKLYHVATTTEQKTILDCLMELSDVGIIIDNFINAFITKSVQKSDGVWYLHGNFNLGGTVSGRLSSGGPNLQNIPNGGTKYGKLIKDCFTAPKGWIMVGADFASLEDRISALTTRDPNKIKVYTDGYDGHCIRAYSYFGDQMPDIDPNSVTSINSIADKYPALRQDSKPATFALTYQGMWMTLVNNLGWSESKAKLVEQRYHELYKVSDNWVQDKLKQASIDGYVTTAFGLRLRTPILKQVLMGARKTPYEAAAEGRTAGNALGQGYGMLNNRTGIEIQQRIFDAGFENDILPIAAIHDATYFIIRDDVDLVHWLNSNLIECMEWQGLPEIQHPTVGLGGELSVFYPSWKYEIKLPNHSTKQEIKEICQKSMKSLSA
jgi:DNA polymerase-1